MSRALTLADIADLREYEREREAFRDRVIELKKRRRIGVGPHVTFLFENRDTIRFQIQEMARVEKLITDDAIEAELRAYNPLIPEPGTLSATMFIELTSEELLREWLPKLVGIERSVAVQLCDGTELLNTLDPAHEAQLTRADITASVHYLRWEFDPTQVETFRTGPAKLVIRHPNYPYESELSELNLEEMRCDLG